MIAVLEHELSLYYHSMKAYVFGAFLLVFTGIGALLYNINASVANFEYVLSFISIIFIILIPILTMRIMAEENEEDEIIYLLSEQEIDFDTAVNALKIDSFTSGESASTQELSMTVYLDSEDYPSVTVTIYQYDGENCLVYLDGEQVGLMERSLMVDLREAVTSIVLGLE